MNSDTTQLLSPGLEPPPEGVRIVPVTETDMAVSADEVTRAERSGLAVLPMPEPRAIPGHEILGVLGRGGMGVVYLARQLGLNRLVAIKMILAGEHADAENLARFRTEVEAVARLQHPHVVQIHDVGSQGALAYYTMEYVDGGSLHRYLEGKPLPFRLAAEITVRLARAVQVAHDHGIVHRDLKPGNILLAGLGEAKARRPGGGNLPLPEYLPELTPKIADFGLAKREGDDSHLTRTGLVVGTPSYLAPEQARGDHRQSGPGIDIYALGSILYEMLTGRPPFQSDMPMDTLMRVIKDEPIPPRQVAPALPRDLDTICLKCLQKEPAQRYASARELADDLQRFLDDQPIHARPASLLERGTKWCKRHPAVAALGTALAILTIVSFLAVLNLWQQAAYLAANESRARHEADRDRQRAVEAFNQARELLYVNLLASAERAWLTFDPAQAKRLLADCPSEQRHWEWDYLRRRIEGSWRNLDLPGHQSGGLRFAPNSAQLYSIGREGNLYLWDVETAKLRSVVRLQHDGKQFVPLLRGVLSPDLTELATCNGSELLDDRTVACWDAATGVRLATFGPVSERVLDVAYSADGRWLGAVSSRPVKNSHGGIEWRLGDVTVWDRATAKVHLHVPVAGRSIRCLAFSADGVWLALGGWDRTIQLWNVPQAKLLRVLRDHPDPVNVVAFHPRQPVLAAGCKTHVQTWDVNLGERLQNWQVTENSVHCLTYSADGRRLINGNTDRTVRVWNADTGQRIFVFSGHETWVHAVAVSPNGQWIASAGETLKIWDGVVGPNTHMLTGSTTDVFGVAIDPAARRVAGAGDTKGLRIWDVETRKLIRQLATPREPRAVAFSPDGNLIAACSDDHGVRIWEAATGELRQELKGNRQFAGALAFSPDGRFVATGCYDGFCRVWDVATGSLVHQFTHMFTNVTAVAWHPEGRYLVTGGSDKQVRVWDTHAGKLERLIPAHATKVADVRFSRDGALLATSSNTRGTPGVASEVNLWDFATGRLLRTIKGHHGSTWSVDFSPDRRRLVTAGEDFLVKVWDLETGRELLALRGHTDDVRRLGFSRDGRYLVSCSDDQLVILWDGRPLGPEPPPPVAPTPPRDAGPSAPLNP